MKKFILPIIALAAVSTTAYAADRSEDIRKTEKGHFINNEEVMVEPFAIPDVNMGDGWLFADGQYVKDPNEVRRLDEKNG